MMDAQVTKVRPITIAIVALGGEGGGVLADWIVDLAQHGGYLAQATSVPGVAQRTGATIYYVELFPKAAAQAAGREPVLALMPMPGDVDVVLASELMEAARAIERGFVTPDKTLLIASTHRVFAMTEKIALADGRADAAALLAACRDAARQLVAFDMAALAEATGSVMSAVLFGALAGSGALPFPRTAFEAAIRRGQVGVNSSLAAFGAGFEAAHAGEAAAPAARPSNATAYNVSAPLRELLDEAQRGLFRRGTDDRRRGHRTARRLSGRRLRQGFSRAAEALSRHRAAIRRRLRPAARRKRRGSSRSAWPTRTRSASRTSRSAPSRFARVREEVQVAGRPDPRDRRVLPSARAGDRGHASGRSRALAAAHRLGPRPRSSASRARERSSRPRRSAGSCCSTCCRSSRPLRRRSLRLCRRAGGACRLARPGRRDRTYRLRARAAGRAHAQPW